MPTTNPNPQKISAAVTITRLEIFEIFEFHIFIEQNIHQSSEKKMMFYQNSENKFILL
jgi:hypothetical protein